MDRYAQEGLFGGREEDRVREQEVEDEEVRRKVMDQMEDSKNEEERSGSLRGSLKGSVRLGKGSKSALRDVGALEAFEQGEKCVGRYHALLTDTSPLDRAIAVDKLDVSAKLNFSRSVDVLIRYLTDRRQKCAQALSSTLPSLRPLPSMPRPSATQSELLALPDIPLADLTPDQLARVAQVVDTALFKSYLATKPVMVGPLCRIENWCEVEEVEDLLLTAQVRLKLSEKAADSKFNSSQSLIASHLLVEIPRTTGLVQRQEYARESCETTPKVSNYILEQSYTSN